jgi:hypothetical protein
MYQHGPYAATWNEFSTPNKQIQLPRSYSTGNLLKKGEILIYPDETVRLLRDIPEAGLAAGKECQVVRVIANDVEGVLAAVEVKYYSASVAHTATLPLDAVQLVLSRSSEQRTAVFWDLAKPPEEFIEACLHSIMDQDFQMLDGQNLVELQYDSHDRWWKRGKPMSDPAGAHIAVAGSRWDGCVAAFSGPQRFHLEFRLKGRGGPCVLLHERDESYQEQINSTPACMRLARVVMNLYAASGAQCCAFPVADPWLMDEDWNSLLRHPYYPDFFIVPETLAVPNLPEEFRKGLLIGKRAVLTTLPIKFSPHDKVASPLERDHQISSLRKCASLGEKYYDQMYNTRLNTTGLYSDVKDTFIDAISLANKLGFNEYAAALDKRLEHIKSVFRSQFT